MKATATSLTARPLPESFERIFVEHSGFVYRTAYRVTGSVEDAEDVLQALFLRLLESDMPADVKENPKRYLYRAAVNMSLNVLRSRKRNVLTDGVENFEATACVPQEPAIFDVLREAIAELRPGAAEILILRHVHGYTDREIAGFLGTSRGTVAVSLFRTRARLRKVLKARGDKLR